MPRSGRGGQRRGLPGQNYGNRRDLQMGPRKQPITTGPSAGYGQRVALERIQRAAPMGPPPTDAVPVPEERSWPVAGSLGPLDGPTQRPDEPVTAGIALGPGAGPEALRLPPGGADEIAWQLRALARRYPTPALQEILEDLDDGLA